jgi:hypothetical protein
VFLARLRSIAGLNTPSFIRRTSCEGFQPYAVNILQRSAHASRMLLFRVGLRFESTEIWQQKTRTKRGAPPISHLVAARRHVRTGPCSTFRSRRTPDRYAANRKRLWMHVTCLRILSWSYTRCGHLNDLNWPLKGSLQMHNRNHTACMMRLRASIGRAWKRLTLFSFCCGILRQASPCIITSRCSHSRSYSLRSELTLTLTLTRTSCRFLNRKLSIGPVA